MNKIKYTDYLIAACVGFTVSIIFFMILESLIPSEFGQGIMTGTAGTIATNVILNYFERKEEAKKIK